MRIALAQINPIIGALSQNAHQIISYINKARDQGTDLIVFPELSLTGYPPLDLLLNDYFIDEVQKQLAKVAEATQNISAIIGLPRKTNIKSEKRLYNSAVIITNGVITGYANKILLPNYDVFNEKRYFIPGTSPHVFHIGSYRIGITICEDIWAHSPLLQDAYYLSDPVAELCPQRLDCLINLSASPYALSKIDRRVEVAKKASQTLQCPVLLCNQVGGNDSLLFDGSSFCIDSGGILARAASFQEDLLTIDLEDRKKGEIAPLLSEQEQFHNALIMGIRDYFHKTGHQKACLGLSGGIDSAVVAVLAAHALGPQHVTALYMPSQFSSQDSQKDSLLLAQRLGIQIHTLPIESVLTTFLNTFQGALGDLQNNLTHENLQARIRGLLLMSYSNDRNALVLATGNKSELALGYSTLYGDMCGALMPIGDLLKHQVYDLANWINRKNELIPDYTLTRPPSAELRYDQKDSDSLPDYSFVDALVQEELFYPNAPQKIAQRLACPISDVQSWIRTLHRYEYKRKQAPPILRVSEKSFGLGRCFPIVEGWLGGTSFTLKK